MNTAVAGLYGSLTVNADGTYTYVPNAAAINALHDGSYTDTFTVQTTDVHGAVSSSAILTVDVTGANERRRSWERSIPPRRSSWWPLRPRRSCLPRREQSIRSA